jgi:hypothetical protein
MKIRLLVASVTYGQKGRDLLRRAGISCLLRRVEGCRYVLEIEAAKQEQARQILREGGVGVLS